MNSAKRGKIILICVFALIVLAIALPIAGGVFERWRAERDWAACKAGLDARGEHLSIDFFEPSPVPDDKNLALSPLMTPLLEKTVDPKTGESTLGDPNAPLAQVNWKIKGSESYPSSPGWETGHFRELEQWQAYYRKTLPAGTPTASAPADILAALQRFDPTLAQLRAEMQARPLCRFPLRYEAGAGMAMPHLTVLTNVVHVLALRAEAELALNRPDQALDDVLLGYRVAGAIRDEPVLIDGLVRITMIAILQQPVWEGIASHRWSPDQLTALEQELRTWDFPADFNRCMRAERCSGNWACEQIRADPKTFFHMSSGTVPEYVDVIAGNGAIRSWWIAVSYRNEIWIDTILQDQFLNIFDEKTRTVSVQRARDAQAAIQNASPNPYTVLGKIMLPVFTSVPEKFARVQVFMDEAVVACEIERYRLAQGKLPATLGDLHMANLPHDIINGQPLHYRLLDTDNYLLYSVGWNETDDGGKIVTKKDSDKVIDEKQGDWVWTLKPAGGN